ncbi:aldehyde dehydrogenase family protein [Salinisphaera sp. SWV1]|uniref:aldehyde dehydrogenase family protein n=1 Tax=Salinisphaera sp. SWV1 TaxID=3454139 RepID=UPI003F858CAA
MSAPSPTIPELLDTMDYGPSPESADQALAWLDRHQRRFGHFIGGTFVEPTEGGYFQTVDPATETPLAEVAQGSPADIDKAVAAAKKALGSWSKTPGHERARRLYALARLVQKHARLLAVLECLDNGKPIREARDGDIPLVARHFYHHAGWADLIETEFPGHQPVGVCGQIIPWNFPLLMLAWKVAPALAAGNTVVLKPAEYTPLTALAFAELCREAGLPPGTVNFVTGDGETGAALVGHADVAKIAFTGSTAVGRWIRERTAGSGKKLSLELGGKSPFVVFEDSDLDAAVEGVVDSIWFNQGQVCCAGSRILVQEGVAERFHHKLRERMATLRVGNPLDKSTDIGAIVDRRQLARIIDLVERGVAEGASCYQPPMAVHETGFFYPPTLITDVESSSLLMREEIFGPVVTSSTFRTPDEAVALANDTRYGLAASVWSESISRALDVAGQIQAGVVWINTANQFDAAAGFGGYRESGYGREGGREGLQDYLTAEPVKRRKTEAAPAPVVAVPAAEPAPPAGIDRTTKLYIGGKQSRPDSGYSYAVAGTEGRAVGLAPLANRKDIRNAVAAARKAAGWSQQSAHARAQVVFYLAENLDARHAEFAEMLVAHTGLSRSAADKEVALSVRLLFHYAALADKYDGRVHSTAVRHATLAMNEPWGVLGMVCADATPLSGLVGLVAPAIALGNRAVAVVSQSHALIALALYSVLDTSDVPGGVINLLCGDREELAGVLAAHDDVDALWCAAMSVEQQAALEVASSGNLKPVTVIPSRRWSEEAITVVGASLAPQAIQVKNIWIPYGD